jgi:Pyruvate/2-oxoacid:ferredoxin oxidoreductase gamma subunit
MLRIRFHGRGGQGMKTASRILGSAAFHAGSVVQDSPVYGAERRGAPMAAFTRIAREPIRERGMIIRADLVVVADDTLLADVAAQPLAGCDAGGTVLINSKRSRATTYVLRAYRAGIGRGLYCLSTAAHLVPREPEYGTRGCRGSTGGPVFRGRARGRRGGTGRRPESCPTGKQRRTCP